MIYSLTELQTRFTHHAPKEGQTEKYESIRKQALELAIYICESCPESRESALALTHLEDTVMWANAAIARRE